MMKLPELKRRVRKSWESLNTWKDGVVIQPENFNKDMKSFGDRRYKRTWIKALARFEAMRSYETCLDSYMLIVSYLNFKPGEWDYEYRHEIVDEFLMYPDSLELIKQGLEQLFSSDFGPKEREEAHGFYSLVEERAEQPGRISLPVRFDRSITGANTTA